MNRTTKLWITTLLVLIGGLGVGLAIVTHQNSPSATVVQDSSQTKNVDTFKDDLSGFSVDIPSGLARADLSEQDAKDRVTLRLKSSSDPPISVTARSEDGLKRLGDGSGSLIDKLLANTSLSFPRLYKDYKVIDQKQYSVSNHSSGEVLFTYSNQGTLIKQRFVIIIRDSDLAEYIVFQAPASSFDELNNKYFDPLVSSAKFAQ